MAKKVKAAASSEELTAAKEKYKITATNDQILEVADLIKKASDEEAFKSYKANLQALRTKKK